MCVDIESADKKTFWLEKKWIRILLAKKYGWESFVHVNCVEPQIAYNF